MSAQTLGLTYPISSSSSPRKEAACCQRLSVAPFPPAFPPQGSGALTVKTISRLLNKAAANHPSLHQCSSNLHINPTCQNQEPPKSSKVDDRQIYKMNRNLEKEQALPFVAESTCTSGEAHKNGARKTDRQPNKRSAWALAAWTVSILGMVTALLGFVDFRLCLEVRCQRWQRQRQAKRWS